MSFDACSSSDTMSARSVFRGLREVDSFFVRNYGATSYRELLAAMRADPLYSRTQYVTLQKRAGRMWQAEKKYRAQQRAARTVAPSYLRRFVADGYSSSTALAMDPIVVPAPQANNSAAGDPAAHLGRGEGNASFPWPAAHAGCVMQ
jgi:hypothetical protein